MWGVVVVRVMARGRARSLACPRCLCAYLVADAPEVFHVQGPSEALAQHHVVAPHGVGEPPVAVHVAEVELAAGLEGHEAPRHDGLLVGAQVDDAVGDDQVHGVRLHAQARQGQVERVSPGDTRKQRAVSNPRGLRGEGGSWVCACGGPSSFCGLWVS